MDQLTPADLDVVKRFFACLYSEGGLGDFVQKYTTDYSYASGMGVIGLSDDNELVIEAFDATSDGYDGYSLETERFTIPLSVFLDPAAYLAGVAIQREAEKKAELHRAYERQRQQEDEERAQFERLKAKFG